MPNRKAAILVFVLWIISCQVAIGLARNESMCSESSLTCGNKSVCSRYHREESSNSSREASQCGNCLKGYSPELPLKSTAAAYRCERHNDLQWNDVISYKILIFPLSVIFIWIVILCWNADRSSITATIEAEHVICCPLRKLISSTRKQTPAVP